MRQIFFSVGAVSLFIICMGFISIPPPPGYRTTLIGTWDVVKPTGRFSDTTVDEPLIPSSMAYEFRDDDSVIVTLNDADTTVITMGWELHPISEDTIHFSNGPSLYIYNKTTTNFNGRMALSQSAEYIDLRFRKRKVVIGNPVPINQ